jgi:hypothetical protein
MIERSSAMFSRSLIRCVFTAIFTFGACQAAPQANPRIADLVGVWEMTAAKDLKTGAVWATGEDTLWWFQFARSHWMAMQTLRERAPLPSREAFEKMSADERTKASYARIWDDKGQQVFAARGGTYELKGDELHQVATIALFAEIIGLDRVLRIVRLDRDTLVVRTEFPDLPDVQNEWTFRRIE